MVLGALDGDSDLLLGSLGFVLPRVPVVLLEQVSPAGKCALLDPILFGRCPGKRSLLPDSLGFGCSSRVPVVLLEQVSPVVLGGSEDNELGLPLVLGGLAG